MAPAEGFVPPPYPYDRLDELKAICAAHDGGMVDLSIGAPFDPPPSVVLDAIANADAERGYPPSRGTPAFKAAAAAWINDLTGASVDPANVRATVGSKEFVVSLAHFLKLRTPERDTVLYPAVSYPSYAMGARLANCRAVAVPVDDQWRLDLAAIDPADAERALCLWSCTPGNPAGGLDDLDAVYRWGRDRGVFVASDECYIEFTWDGPPRTILTNDAANGTPGALAVHSLSKRSNFAGGRSGFYAGDPDVVHYLGEVRTHWGLMQAGPMQAAAVAAFGDPTHVAGQAAIYRRRLERLLALAHRLGSKAQMPAGGFYLWAPAPDGDAWAFARRLAEEAGALVSPGEFYGQQGADHVRIAAVQPDDRIELVAQRLGL
jgi:aspartate/methionine/tyrosine aminotransferase